MLAYDLFVFCKQKTAYEMRISDWSSDVCSSDLVRSREDHAGHRRHAAEADDHRAEDQMHPGGQGLRRMRGEEIAGRAHLAWRRRLLSGHVAGQCEIGIA